MDVKFTAVDLDWIEENAKDLKARFNQIVQRPVTRSLVRFFARKPLSYQWF